MAKVIVEGQEFTLSPEKTQDLMQWLTANGGVRVESAGSNFDGQQLLNEVGDQHNVESVPINPKTHRDPAEQPKGDPNKTWDFGTPWA